MFLGQTFIFLQIRTRHCIRRLSASVDCTVANLPDSALEPITSVAKTGIYFGYARVHRDHEGSELEGMFAAHDLEIQPMVMSLGWNPYYKNEKLTAVGNCPDLLASLWLMSASLIRPHK